MQKHFFVPASSQGWTLPTNRCKICMYYSDHSIHWIQEKDGNLFAQQRKDNEMTGRQYLFKQVGHAFASLGYIIKWYMKHHTVFPWENFYKHYQLPGYNLREHLCPVCKWKNYLNTIVVNRTVY